MPSSVLGGSVISIHRPVGPALDPRTSSNSSTLGAARNRRMPRLIGVVAIGAAIALGTTGCNLISTQATQIPYSPADGITVPYSGPIEVRNALFVADEDGVDANFVAALINSSDSAQTLHLEIGDDTSDVIKETVRVPANTTISLGVDKKPILVKGLDVKPGADVLVYFQSGDAEGIRVSIPVLDGTLDYLAPLAP